MTYVYVCSIPAQGKKLPSEASTRKSSEVQKIPDVLASEEEPLTFDLGNSSSSNMADKPLQFEVKKAEVPEVTERQGIAMSELGEYIASLYIPCLFIRSGSALFAKVLKGISMR